MLSASVTWRSAYIFFTSSIAFLNVIIRYITIGKGMLDSIIRGYALNTNSVGIRLFSPIEWLITLKAIYSAISLLISGISEVIMWYMRCKGPW
jgi:hypothetical protein